ncbi:MAG: Asp-tRNA(Asn)/Glu-tRNA(Gln) amidotransferase subunit GatB [Patescibacteria group bacterium]|nr:Asp-tRNA(Asn)/Glu-tRNA(Gln) amidotransferase subunit GatB [Patescibacteria group bacterium]
MASYRPTIGLEIHAELATRSKMFCGCRNDPNEKRPNVNICPVCMAHPGTLPVINKEAVRKILLVGTALDGVIASRTYFDRKNYFYPDIPKGYQISQYKDPLVSGGKLAGVSVTRVHLEEDTARSTHEKDRSLVDFNRAGVPLMELVTEPVIHDAATAGAFARELQLLLRYLKAGEANMEKGEMRVEANISVSTGDTLGTKVEVKNLNSFRSVERAIAYEVERQSKVLEEGGMIEQETRGWDEGKQATFSQRKKESSHDYRYFPEPDLPELILSTIPEFSPLLLRESLPELPWARRERYLEQGLKKDDADMFVREALLGNFFDMVLQHTSKDIALRASNYLASDIAGSLERGEVASSWLTDERNALRFGRLMQMIAAGSLSSRGGKDTLMLMFESSEDPEVLASSRGLLQENNSARLDEIARGVIAAHQSVADDYRAGKATALQFLIGQGMRESKGSANPAALKEAFEKLLK